MVTHSFQCPQPDFNVLDHFKLEKHLIRSQNLPNVFICLLDHADEAPLAITKIEHQRWPAKSIISGRSGTHYVAMVRKLVCLYCRAHLVESYCKESTISDANWLRYRFSSQLIRTRLSETCHQLANLHILKTGISLDEKRYLKASA